MLSLRQTSRILTSFRAKQCITARFQMRRDHCSFTVHNNLELRLKRCDNLWRHQKIRQISLCKGEDSEKESSSLPPILSSLEETFDSELTSLQKIKLHSMKKHLLFLQDHGFPLPDHLTKQQWDRLMGLLERGHRNEYLDAIMNGEDEDKRYEELKEADLQAQKGLEFTEETFKNVMKPEYFQHQSLEERLKMINHVYQEMKDAGEVLPLAIAEKGLRELITLKNPRQIEQFFIANGMVRTRKEHDFVKKRARSLFSKEGREKFHKERSKEKHIVYGIGRNCIMLRHYQKDIDKSLGWYAVREFNEWGQPLVIDLSFMSQMSFRAAKSVAYREITYSLVENRTSPSPFAIHFTNYDANCEKTKMIFDFHPHLRDDPAYPAALSSKCHTELFDKERLVYLSPNSDNELIEYNPDDIYVIGALNDAGHQTPFTLAQAKKDGIRHVKLPLKKYIGMSPELNVEHVVAIMLDFRRTQDWFYSCRNVPARFLRNRWLSQGDSRKMEALYRAHGQLSPITNWSLKSMSPEVYRSEYTRIVEETLDQDEDRDSIMDSLESMGKFRGRNDLASS